MRVINIAAIFLVLLVMAPLLLPATLASAEISIPHRIEIGKSSLSIEYVWLVLKASQIPWIIGSDIRSLHLATCIGGKLVDGVIYVLPRKLVRSFEAELNKTVYIPIYGSTNVQSNDLLLLLVPIATNSLQRQGLIISNQCSWGRHYALLRLHNRVQVVVNPGKQFQLLNKAYSGRQSLQSLKFYIYFDKSTGINSPVIPSSIPDKSVIEQLARRIGIVPGNNSIWYTRLRTTLARITAQLSIDAKLERAKGWLMTRNYTRIATTIKAAVSTKTMKNPSIGVEGFNYIDGSGSGSLKFYWFSLSLDKRLPGSPVKLPPGHSIHPSMGTIYIGPYVENLGLHVRVKNNAAKKACIEVHLRVYKYISNNREGEYVSQPIIDITRRYYINPGAIVPIEVSPSGIPWSSTKLGVDAWIKNCGSTEVEVLDATIDFLKSYPSMPVQEQREGLQILSYGIMVLSKDLSRIARYVKAYILPGLYFIPKDGKDKLSFMFSYPEGIYLNYNYGENDGATLYLDIAVRAPYNSASGLLKVYVNGYQVAEKHLSISSGGYRVVRLNVPLRLYTDYFKWMGGGLITIQADFNNPVVVYIDSMIKYNYLPEVYDASTGLTIWWPLNPSAAAKVLLVGAYKDTAVLGISYTVERPYVAPRADQDLIFGFEASTTASATSISIHSGSLTVKIPASVSGERPPVGTYKHEKSYSILDEAKKYIGVANTLHHILSTLTTIVSFVVEVGKSANAVLFVAGTIIDIIKAAKGQTALKAKGTETINGVVYRIYQYSWSAGWSDNPHWLQMRIYLQTYSWNKGSFFAYLSSRVNGWELKSIPVKIVMDEGASAPYEPPGFYGRSDIGYS